MLEEVAPDVEDHALGAAHHRLRVPERREGAHGIDAGRGDDARGEPVNVEGREGVDDRLDHEGAHELGHGAHACEHAHNEHLAPGMAHVGEQFVQRVPQVRGPAAPHHLGGHQASPPSTPWVRYSSW